MEVRWLTAFLDLPADRFDLGVTFWMAVTQTRRSRPRGAVGQFATLIPPTGDAHLRVQRTSQPPRIHLDLHVDSVDDARQTAERLGATVDVDLRHVIMNSPGGFTFCFVADRGESRRPGPAHPGLEHRLDQVCLDIPATMFEAEIDFWHSLTGWDLHRSTLPEFASLAQPDGFPWRLLFQRLGADDDATQPRAHLDVACGDRVAEVRTLHERFGAKFVADGLRWVTMRDPAGMLYCLTQRDVATGLIEG